ncbi:MAG TPA: DHA2 family efflux MFS transporter permease subunit [Gaiellaceae bacterium]|nr:DHA2 family efflux MFS transporter permease subunit [Gaiellaceae bacterium]
MSSDARRWWALGALVPVALALNLDATVLSLALPTLARALHASTAQLQWFVSGYLLVFAAAMVPGGMLGDRFGRKRLLLVALAIFALGSLACAYATSPGAFIAARLLLGLGAALATPLTLGVLPVLFGEEERKKALAIVMAATMLGYPLGPILGGWLLSSFWWGWVFLINLPVVAIAAAAVIMLLPESRSSERPRIDGAGVALSSAGLALVSYGVIEAGQQGWGSAAAVGGIVAGALMLAGFVAWERRAREPLLDPRLFAIRGFTIGTLLSAVVSFALIGLFFAVPLYFQEVIGTGPMGSGLRLLPMIGGLLAGAGAAVKLAERVGTTVVVAAGFVLVAAGLALGATTGLGSGSGFAAAWVAVVGLGTGFAMPTTMDAALGALSPNQAGVGSGTIQALRMVGGSFGAAILGSILNAAYRGRLDLTGVPAAAAHAARDSVAAGTAAAGRLGSPALLHTVQTAYVHGLDVMLLTSAAVAAVGVPLTLAFLPRQAPRRSDDTVETQQGAPGELLT